MVGIVCHGYGRDAWQSFDTSHMDWVFVEVHVPGSAPINILPGRLVVEREFVGRNPDNGAVLVVACLNPEWDTASDKVENIWILEK